MADLDREAGRTDRKRPLPDFSPLFAGAPTIEYAPGRVLFGPGMESSHIYLIRSGRVRISRQVPDGRELTLAVLDPGEMLGEIAALDGGERTAVATALTKASLACLTVDRFKQAVAAHPEQILNLLLLLCQRLRQVDQMLEEISFLGVKERLRSLQGRLAARGINDLTHQEMAEMIGTTRESVTRALAEMRRENDRPG